MEYLFNAKIIFLVGNLEERTRFTQIVRHTKVYDCSIHDLAKLCMSVSIATVSRVVNNSAGVKESKVAANQDVQESL